MKTHTTKPTTKLTTILATLALGAIGAAQATAQETIWEHNFAENPAFNFAYGTWTGQITGSDEGAVISGTADQAGGAGFQLNPALNLENTPREQLFAIIRAKLLPENTAQKFGVLLCSNPGADATVWQFAASRLGTEQFTDIEIPLADNPDYIRDPGVNYSNIIEIQIQGDYSNPGNVALVIQSLKLIRR